MYKTSVLAAASAGALALALAAPQAVAQPRGSAQDSLGGSCRNVQTLQSGYVSAECRDGQGRYMWSTIYAPQCRSPLSNRDGVITCYGAEARTGGYVSGPQAQSDSPVGALLGALAGAFLGTNTQTSAYGQPSYTPGATYPAWGETGYGDPRTDPRFGQDGWGYGANGQWVPISRRQAWLQTRIDAGQRQDRLSYSEASALRRDLDELERLEARYERGGLTSSERADLDRRFETLSARIRVDGPGGRDSAGDDINQRQARLDARIDAGVRDGSLTRTEAARLRSEYESLARLEASYRQRGITSAERADLDRRFDALSGRIRDDRGDNQDRRTDIDQRQARLDARIDAGVRDGSLTRTEAARLRSEYETLARLEASYRQRGLTDAERADLDRRFDALSSRIRDDRDGRDDRRVDIDKRQARLDSRIDAGVRDGSLTRTEAARLRSDYQALVRLEASYRRNGLTEAERSDLDRRFDVLSARIRDDRRDRDTRS